MPKPKIATPWREIPDMVANRYKFLPTSVWTFGTNKLVKSIINDTNENIRKEKDFDSASYKTYGYSPVSISEFPEELARRIVAFWSEPHDMVLDNCMGRATRGVVTLMEGRNYIGVDIDSKTVENNRVVLSNYMKSRSKLKDLFNSFRLITANGCNISMIRDNSIDFNFTCPPYWCIEQYSGAEGDLSYCLTYESFLNMISLMVKEVYRTLKFGKFSVWVVGDFRIQGHFYNFHGDLIDIFKLAGFKHWDTIINVLKSPFTCRSVRATSTHYYTAKTHDYTLVFWKPSTTFIKHGRMPEGYHLRAKREQKRLNMFKDREEQPQLVQKEETKPERAKDYELSEPDPNFDWKKIINPDKGE